jgi:hypothetical protein
MRNGYLASLSTLLVLAGVAHTQQPQHEALPTPNQLPTPRLVAVAPEASPVLGEATAAGPLCDSAPEVTMLCTADLEYILWFSPRAGHDGTAIAATGVIGQPDTRVLVLGDSDRGRTQPVSGGRATLGYWWNRESPWVRGGIRDVGAEAVFLFVGERSTNRTAAAPNLVRPFLDLNEARESGLLVAAPGLASGQVAGYSQFSLWGAEANLRTNVDHDVPGTTYSLDALAGFRFLNADYRTQIVSFSSFAPNIPANTGLAFLSGNRLSVFDSFATQNRFYGGQVGLAGKFWWMPAWSLEGTFKFGLGVTTEDVEIEGSQVRTLANQTITVADSGLLALRSNSGQFHENKFTIVPEADFKLAYVFTRHITVSLGMTILYWSRLARATEQIDRTLDIAQISNFPQPPGALATGQPNPGVPFNQSDLLLVGGSLGLEFRW